MKGAGYPINRDGPGVRCYGNIKDWDDMTPDGHRRAGTYAPGWKLVEHPIKLSRILLSCDALINMPILKYHSLPRITFAMKNHFGSFDQPGYYHKGDGEIGRRALGELNALPPIKDRTRLIIGDVLTIVGANSRYLETWHKAVTGDSILMSFDPVAADAVGTQLFLDALTPEGPTPQNVTSPATTYLENAARLGLGTNDLDYIHWVELNLA